MGWRALLRFSSVTSNSQREHWLFLAGTTVTWWGERLLQMFIKVRCGTLQVAVWMELWALRNSSHVQTCFCLYFEAGKRIMWSRPVSAAVGQGGVTATQSGFVSGRGFSESPVQIPAKTQESPAWSRTYWSAAYLDESQPILEQYYWDPFFFFIEFYFLYFIFYYLVQSTTKNDIFIKRTNTSINYNNNKKPSKTNLHNLIHSH